MQSVKLFKFLLLSAVGCLCASACSLPAPAVPDGGFKIGGQTCTISADAGAVDFGSSVVATGDVENVVTPVACAGSGTGNPNAIDKYSQGYGYNDPAVLAKLNPTMASISVHDEMWQMGGMPYGSPAGKNYTNTQRSQDTDSIRGFRYRDASRGVNLHEDMDGNHPSNLGVDGQYNVGYATAFPVSMARGAAFDLDLEYAVGEAIADEMQAIGDTLLLAPCMNILRHPYWGRSQEVYGEDTYLTGRLASAMTIGIQEHIAANAKHYMAYDVEASRQTNVSLMDEQTLREIYGRHFRMVVQDAGVSSVMASYNSVGSTKDDARKSTINRHTLTDVLRNDFGFKGFVLSDWWAVPGKDDILDSATQTSTAKALFNAGLDVELPWLYNYSNIQSLFNNGDIKKADLDTAVSRILYEKYRFNADPLTGSVGVKPHVSLWDAGKGVITCDYTHIALAKKAALESMVLLKNDGGLLPISPSVHKLAVVGATVPFDILNIPLQVNFATDVRTGDYGSSRVDPDPAKSVGPFAGFCQATGGTVSGDGKSCNGGSVNVTTATNNTSGDLSAVMNAVNDADFVVVMAGLTPRDEGEEYTFASDRNTNCQNTSSCLELDAKQTGPFSGIQDKLIQQVAATGKPMVVVLEGGSVINVPWLSQVPALVMAWYPGQRGGEAIADLLWGQVNGVSYNFGGKLPFTWGLEQQYGDPFDTAGGTTQFSYYIGYRYFDQNKLTPVFPFGAGHSYTNFALTNLQLGCSSMAQGAVLPVVVNVTNTGAVAGDDTVMVFVHFPNTQARRSFKELKGFARVSLAAGESKQVTVPVRLSDLDYFQADSGNATTGHWQVESGPVDIMVTDGSQNPDGTTAFLPTQTVNVTGYQVGSPQ